MHGRADKLSCDHPQQRSFTFVMTYIKEVRPNKDLPLLYVHKVDNFFVFVLPLFNQNNGTHLFCSSKPAAKQMRRPAQENTSLSY
jgi:hypothetical protein